MGCISENYENDFCSTCMVRYPSCGRHHQSPIEIGMYYSGRLNNKMLEKRASAASIVLNNSTLWVVGGEEETDNVRYISDTSEFITFEYTPIWGPSLPFSVSEHCMIQFNENAIFLIGGIQDLTTSNKTWIIDPTNGFKIKEGPALNFARTNHSCGKMVIKGRLGLNEFF